MLAEIKRTHLNRALSKLGLCSRGVAERWIAEGRVSVNGVRADSPEQWVDLGKDRIEVAPEAGSGPAAASASAPGTAATIGPQMPGTAAARPAARGHVYLVMNKPAGYVTTRNDELGRKTVYDLLPEAFAGGWVFPVGRLDKDSEGLLLMTDDGEWANLLTDPEFHVDKVYRVKLDGRPREGELQRFRSGIMLDGSFTLPADVAADGGSWYRVTLREGRNRQIRRMFHELGYKVKRLVRVSIGGLEAEGLAEGEVRELDKGTVQTLKTKARLSGGLSA